MAENKLGSPYNWEYLNTENIEDLCNNSNIKEDFELLFFQENFDSSKLKDILRNTVREPNQTVRKFLWKRILTIDLNNNLQSICQKYEEKRSKLFGKTLNIKAELPTFVDNHHLLYYYLNENGRNAVTRILCILAAVHPDITFSPLLLPLASLFLHYMSENECYACLLAVIESHNKITQTEIHWQTTCNVFRRLAKKYCDSSYEYLIHASYKCTNNLEKSFKIVDDYVWWIFEYLPFNYMLNIVDSFLMQGQKVLYRYAIVLVDKFVKCLVRRPSLLDDECVNNFCKNITIPLEKLNKAAFSLRNMSRKDLKTLFQIEESYIIHLRAKNIVSSQDIVKKKHSEQLFASDNDLVLNYDGRRNMNKHTHSHKNFWKLFRNTAMVVKKWDKRPASVHGRHQMNDHDLPTFSVENTGSTILDASEILQIWRWLPIRWKILELELVYSTDIHGCRLMTLYDKTEFYESTIIIIKTAYNAVFGAFCSASLSNRINRKKTYAKESFFGTGETFLFTLRPHKVKYEWVGRQLKGETEKSQELFIFADNQTFIVGSGGEGSGLQIDENLQHGITLKCNTFLNEPLCTDKKFEVQKLEVLSFKSANT